MTSRHNPPAVERVLIVRLGSMGDVIHALPAAAILRALFPKVEIGWAIEERWVELLCATVHGVGVREMAGLQRPRSPERPLVDRLHLVNTRAWRTQPFSNESWKEAFRVARELRQAHYDAAVDFQGAWKSALVALASRARVRLGFRNPRERGASLFYTRQVTPAGTHVVEQNVSLLGGFVRLEGDNRTAVRETVLREPAPLPELPVEETHELWANQELVRHGLLHRDFAIINPGAGWGAKCWPAVNYAEVARRLAELGVVSLVNFGPGEEELASAVEKGSRGAATASRYTLSELIALMRRARLFIGGDTGPMHLAAALRVPLVAIFGPTDPARNGPYGAQAAVLRSPESVTNHSRRAASDEAMVSIPPAAVVAAAQNLLERTARPQPTSDNCIQRGADGVQRG